DIVTKVTRITSRMNFTTALSFYQCHHHSTTESPDEKTGTSACVDRGNQQSLRSSKGQVHDSEWNCHKTRPADELGLLQPDKNTGCHCQTSQPPAHQVQSGVNQTLRVAHLLATANSPNLIVLF